MGSIFFPLAIAILAAVVWFRWARHARRRNAQSWDSLIVQLRPARNIRQLSESATPEERWRQIDGAHGLCTMYQNAKVMLEMADYAARHDAYVDSELLATLRSDALQIRMLVVQALMQYAGNTLNEGISMNVLRAATMYREMSGRMSELLNIDGRLAAQGAGAR